jgi:peptide/nickel transport system permease protein
MTAIDAGSLLPVVVPVRSDGYWTSVGRRLIRDPVAMARSPSS